MEAAEKAKELYSKYKDEMIEADSYFVESGAKACALMAVDEIIKALESFGYVGAMFDDFKTAQITNTSETNPTDYWHEVKKELEKL